MFHHEEFGGHLIWALQCYVSVDVEGPHESFFEAEGGAAAVAPVGEVEQQQQQQQVQQQQVQQNDVEEELPAVIQDNRKISIIFPLVSCCSCVNNPSSS